MVSHTVYHRDMRRAPGVVYVAKDINEYRELTKLTSHEEAGLIIGLLFFAVLFIRFINSKV
jgi:hypothetical protein